MTVQLHVTTQNKNNNSKKIHSSDELYTFFQLMKENKSPHDDEDDEEDKDDQDKDQEEAVSCYANWYTCYVQQKGKEERQG